MSLIYCVLQYYYLQFPNTWYQAITGVFHLCLSSLLSYCLRNTFAVLQKPCRENFGESKKFGESRFGISEKDRYFLKFPKWQHELVRDYKRVFQNQLFADAL